MPVNYDVVPESTYTQRRIKEENRLWWGLLAGPLIYAIYFIFGYLLSEATCEHSLFGIGPQALVPAIGIATGLGTVFANIVAMMSAYQWQQLRKVDNETDATLSFMAFGGLLLNGLFAFLILVTGIAVMFVDTCRWI